MANVKLENPNHDYAKTFGVLHETGNSPFLSDRPLRSLTKYEVDHLLKVKLSRW